MVSKPTKSQRRIAWDLPTHPESFVSQALANYVTTAQAAALLGVGDNQVRNLLSRGKLEGAKLGHEWIISVASVKAYLQNKSNRGRPASRPPQLKWQIERATLCFKRARFSCSSPRLSRPILCNQLRLLQHCLRCLLLLVRRIAVLAQQTPHHHA